MSPSTSVSGPSFPDGVSDRVQGKRPSGRVGVEDAAAQALLVFLEVAVVAGTAFVGLTQLGGAAQDRSVGEDLDPSELAPLIGPALPGTVPDDAVQVVQGSHAGKVSFDERHAEPDAVRVGVIEPGQHDTVVRVDALARPQALDVAPGVDDAT